MQITTRIDRELLNEIASGLSELLSQTQTLRLHTRELERQLTGATCRTLGLLLRKQRDELHGAEAELAKRTKEVSGRTRPVGRLFHASGPPSHRTRPRVDQRVMDLVEEHEAASGVARTVARRAKERGDLRTYELLARRSDVHDEAAWALAPLVLSSVVSCDLCAARFTCPLSAAVEERSLSAVLDERMDEHRAGDRF